jgi:glycosyltransferase involved in cell wall biosynthesis
MLAAGPLAAAGPGAGTRSYQFARALSRCGELTLVQLSPGPNRELPEDLRRHCSRILQANSVCCAARLPARSRVRSWLRVLRALAFPWLRQWSELVSYAFDFWTLDSKPTSMKWSRRLLGAAVRFELSVAARFFAPISAIAYCHWADFHALRPQILRLLDEVAFDFLWFEHTPNYPYARELLEGKKSTRLICNTQNIEFHAYDRCGQLASTDVAAQWWQVQSSIVKKVERAAFAACDLVVACSEGDKQMAVELVPSANVCVAGNGVDTSYFRPASDRRQSKEPTLLMTGGFEYLPNIDAVQYFTQQVFPLIKQRQPDCRFVVAGLKAGAALQQLGIDDPAVSAVSDPPDMRPEFERAWVVVVPLRAGGGTRLKILEAMAMECPVVSTRLGAEGVPYIDGQHLLLADTPQEFADSVVSLLSDASLRNRLVVEAGSFVRQYYDWQVMCERPLQFMTQDNRHARTRVTSADQT